MRSVCFGFGSVRFGFDYVKAKKPPNICASNHMPACPAALRKAVSGFYLAKEEEVLERAIAL